MLHEYRRVASGSEVEDGIPSSPAHSSISEFFLDEKAFDSPRRVSIAKAYLRSRALWLYDMLRIICGSPLGVFLPSFLRPHTFATTHGAEQTNAISTLDGVRGFACFFVFNFHFLFQFTRTTVHGYGLDLSLDVADLHGNSNRWLHQLPFIRLLHAGRAMVTVFFVLSGYVLARKPLMALRSHSYDTMLKSLSSSIFRRGVRLFLPTIASTFMVFLAVRAGCFKRSTEIAGDGVTLAFPEFHPMYFPTLKEQWWDYYDFVTRYIDFTNWVEWYNLYDPHVWTIPMEFRASMVLFGTLIGLARARPFWRMAGIVAFIIFWSRWGRFEVVLFLSGTLIAELDLITNTWGKRSSGGAVLPTATEEPEGQWQVEINSLREALFVISLYLLSFPDDYPEFTPGFRTLAYWVPLPYNGTPTGYRFWQSVGAVLCLYAINNTPSLRRPFQTALAQYLGKISYAFYLVHGPLIHALGFPLMRWLWDKGGRYADKLTPYGDQANVWKVELAESGTMGNSTFAWCLFAGWCVMLPISIWAADLFWRYVDVPCTKFARWLETKVISKG